MKIAIDVSTIKSDEQKQHRVRGVGFYVQHLLDALKTYVPENDYHYFTQDEKLVGNFDVVHYPYFDPFSHTLPNQKMFKTVTTVHDLTPIIFPKHFPAGIKGNIRWQREKRALGKVDAIITVSLATKKDVERIAKIPEQRVHAIYLAAGEEFKKKSATEKQKEMLRLKYHLPEKFVLSVGDVTWNKNLPRFVRAMMHLSLPLVMVGKTLVEESYDRTNPWNKDLIETQALLKQAKTIQALGFVPSEELALLYGLASVYVMPSLYEGFGLPILEAMASGCPVITTREGSLPEVAGDAASYVDAYSEESIAEGVKKVFDSTTIQNELRIKGEKQVMKFSWEKTALETAAVYENVMK